MEGFSKMVNYVEVFMNYTVKIIGKDWKYKKEFILQLVKFTQNTRKTLNDEIQETHEVSQNTKENH